MLPEFRNEPLTDFSVESNRNAFRAALTAVGLLSTATLFVLPVVALPAVLFGLAISSELLRGAILGAVLGAFLLGGGSVLLTSDHVIRAIGHALDWLARRVLRRTPVTSLADRLLESRNLVRASLSASWSFEEWAQGEYVGRARLPHVPTYRLRVDDQMEFVFRVTRDKIPGPYKLNIGDELQIESAAERELQRTLVVLPDGTITLPLVGSVRAAGLTVQQLRGELDEQLKKYYNEPAITVTPIKVDTRLEDLRFTVAGRSGFGGQVLPGRVTPEGTIQAPGLGSVYVQGLTLEELRNELEARYAKTLGVAMLVSPSLTERATSYVFMGGEVKAPGRYTLEGPTTVMQAIALAGGWHFHVFHQASDVVNERTFCALAGNDIHAAIAALEGRFSAH